MSSTRDKLTKEYATDEIVVEWEASLLPLAELRSVSAAGLRRERRPCVKVNAATADEVEAPARCPSSALRTRRAGVSVSKRCTRPRFAPPKNGPLLVSSGVRVLDAEGIVLSGARRRRSAAAAARATSPSVTARTGKRRLWLTPLGRCTRDETAASP
jgi:hypothetical protein